MTRMLFDDDRRQGRGGESTRGDEETSRGRSITAGCEDPTGSRTRRPREDPSGRGSLTGVEFRRQRSG
jgi:hypothetical protein